MDKIWYLFYKGALAIGLLRIDYRLESGTVTDGVLPVTVYAQPRWVWERVDNNKGVRI